MALIKCSECNKEISNTINSCIHCGCPLEVTNDYQIKRKPKKIKLFIIFLLTVVSVILFTIAFIVGGLSLYVIGLNDQPLFIRNIAITILIFLLGVLCLVIRKKLR